MKLKLWKNPKEVERELVVENYDIMYGTIQDILSLVDDIDSIETNGIVADAKLLETIDKNLPALNNMIKEAFYEYDLTDEDLRKVKVTELIPLVIDLLSYIKKYFGSNGKNV